MIKHTEWVVTISGDCEGRSIKTFGVFTNETAAKEAAKGADIYGGDGNVRERTYMIYDSVEEFKNGKKEELKIQALNKLTKEEKQALGFE